jgi:hypothetical protein
VNTEGEQDQKAHTYGESSVHEPDEHDVNMFMNTEGGGEQDEHVHDLFTGDVNSENGVGKPNAGDREDPVHVFTPSGDIPLLDDEEEL